MSVARLTLVQFSATSCEVHIWDAYEFGTLVEFPEEIERHENGQADIRRDESIDVPRTRQKHLESVEKEDDADEEDTEVAGIRLEGCLVG